MSFARFPRLTANTGLTSNKLLQQQLSFSQKQQRLSRLLETQEDQQNRLDAFRQLDTNLENLQSSANTLSKSSTFDQGTDDIVSDVESFVKDINDTLKQINSEEDDGPFRASSTARRVEGKLKDLLFEDRGGETDGTSIERLSDVGIRLQNDGTISFDQEKFKTELSNNPDKVEQLFRGTTDDITPRTNNNGAAIDFRNFADAQSDDFLGVVDQQTRSIERRLRETDQAIQDQRRSISRERQRQFSKLARDELKLVDLQIERGIILNTLA